MNIRRTALAAAFFLTACGTVQNGPMQRIRVTSDPEGATVTARGCGIVRATDEKITTPAVLLVSRRATRCTIRVAADDYFPREVRLKRERSSKSAENLEAIGLACVDGCASLSEAIAYSMLGAAVAGAGYTVDFATGAMYELEPSRLNVTLIPRFAAPASEDAEEVSEASAPEPPSDGTR